MQRCSRVNTDFHAGFVVVAAGSAGVAGVVVVAAAELATGFEVAVAAAGAEVTDWLVNASVDAAVVTAIVAESGEGHGPGGQFVRPGQHVRQGHHACFGRQGPQLVDSEKIGPGGWCWVIHVHRRWSLKADGP